MPRATIARAMLALTLLVAALFCAPGASASGVRIDAGESWQPQSVSATVRALVAVKPRLSKTPYREIFASGRSEWLSRDPLGERGGLNLYGFVNNDPVNKVDYLGLATIFGEAPVDILEFELGNYVWNGRTGVRSIDITQRTVTPEIISSSLLGENGSGFGGGSIVGGATPEPGPWDAPVLQDPGIGFIADIQRDFFNRPAAEARDAALEVAAAEALEQARIDHSVFLGTRRGRAFQIVNETPAALATAAFMILDFGTPFGEMNAARQIHNSVRIFDRTADVQRGFYGTARSPFVPSTRLHSEIGGEAMDPALFGRIQTAFERKPGRIMGSNRMSERHLGPNKLIEGETLSENVIALRRNPSTSSVYEELIHTAQLRRGMNPETQLLEMEIEAAEKLIRFADRYKIPASETAKTEKRLRQLIRALADR